MHQGSAQHVMLHTNETRRQVRPGSLQQETLDTVRNLRRGHKSTICYLNASLTLQTLFHIRLVRHLATSEHDIACPQAQRPE